MRRLSSAVGMSKSGLYVHFRSKEELQLATIAYVWEIFDEKVLRGSADHPDTALRLLLERWLDYFRRRVFPGGCFVITSAVQFATRDGAVTKALAATVDKEIAALEASIQRANETGELRAAREPSQTAFELHSILMNAQALFHVQGDPAAFERARVAIDRLVGAPDGCTTPRATGS